MPLLGERSNIILTDAVHDMEKRSANEKTSYGGGIKFFTCFQTCFLIRRYVWHKVSFDNSRDTSFNSNSFLVE